MNSPLLQTASIRRKLHGCGKSSPWQVGTGALGLYYGSCNDGRVGEAKLLPGTKEKMGRDGVSTQASLPASLGDRVTGGHLSHQDTTLPCCLVSPCPCALMKSKRLLSLSFPFSLAQRPPLHIPHPHRTSLVGSVAWRDFVEPLGSNPPRYR